MPGNRKSANSWAHLQSHFCKFLWCASPQIRNFFYLSKNRKQISTNTVPHIFVEAAAATMTVATEGPAAAPAVQPVAAQNGKREGATLDPDTDTASSGAVGRRSTAAAAAEAPVTGTEAATAVAEAAEPGAISAEADGARL
jgi:hypothetical protein